MNRNFADLVVAINALQARVGDLEAKLEAVTVEDEGASLVITGENVHVRSGAGSTDSMVNGCSKL